MQPKNEITIDEREDTKNVTCVSGQIKTLDAALKVAKVDTAIWEVERHVINKWEVGARHREQDISFIEGVMSGRAVRKDKWTVQELWQVKVWLRRKVSRPVEDSMGLLMKRMEKHAPKYTGLPKLVKPKSPHLFEVSIFDAHFGKLAWEPETATDYDVKIAEKIYLDAVIDLMNKTEGYGVERILFPLGQDFFHIDNPQNRTVNGTQLEVDTRYHKIIAAGTMACVRAIDHMIQYAPVDVLWVPGNHDRTTSYHLARELKAWYRNCKRVNVDDSPPPRKYYRYGVNLIGYTHGNEEKHSTLPTLMADERSKDWAECKWREWHIGHYHKRQKQVFRMDDSFGSVLVRTLPSLSGTDSWHFLKGYVKGTRAAEMFVWSKNNGYVGNFLATI